VIRSRYLAALSEPRFRLQYLAASASTFGDNVAPVAVAFGVLGLTRSPVDLGLVLAAYTVPLVVLLPTAGVWADRLPRQRIMVASDVVRCATQLAFAFLLVSGRAQVWQLVVLQAIKGTGTAFFNPASVGLTPQTVSPSRLQQANALLSLSTSVSGIIGPAVAGLLVAVTGPGWALALDALTFAASAGFLSRLRPARNPGTTAAGSFWSELAGGWHEASSRPWVMAGIGNFMLFQLVVLSTFQVLGPVVAAESLGGATAWAAIATCVGVGSVLGNVVGIRVRPARPLVAAFLTLLAVTPALAFLAFRLPTPIIAVGAIPLGAAFSLPTVLWYTVLQENIPARALSRVSSFDWMGSLALRPLGYALAAPMAGLVGSGAVLLAAAAVYAAADVLTLTAPGVMALRRRPEGER
jgi:MFS family permease